MKVYNADQVASFRSLIKLLRKLRVMGVLDVSVKGITEFGKPRLYHIEKLQYHPDMYVTELEKAEQSLRDLISEGEMYGFYLYRDSF